MARSSSNGVEIVIGLLIALIVGVFGVLYAIIKYVGRYWRSRDIKTKVKPTSENKNGTNLKRQSPQRIEDQQPYVELTSSTDGNSAELLMYWGGRAEEALRVNNFDEIRTCLQKMSYSMVGPEVTEAEKERFRQFVARFAEIDPLYRDVMTQLRPLLKDTPGLIQSAIYKGQPDNVKELMRYVLYYAEVLGELVRVKKGSSYQLFLPESAPEQLLPMVNKVNPAKRLKGDAK